MLGSRLYFSSLYFRAPQIFKIIFKIFQDFAHSKIFCETSWSIRVKTRLQFKGITLLFEDKTFIQHFILHPTICGVLEQTILTLLTKLWLFWFMGKTTICVLFCLFLEKIFQRALNYCLKEPQYFDGWSPFYITCLILWDSAS